ncbi:uncharacterized protein FPRO_03869 [Fusarium proliferatum ET1]|uniref:Extracellular membrane protein CFEM domain-containing protein n=1 Tax=Fusarium proliferatum (strain ET1) TaxID=1227346 RepID=A0A1L7W8A1_FUSPR|nr:uncharacterized protein FPRO_03869 [Fusarium proliferatum ET1]CVK99329.1 uncharacterized protein FPRN_03674 [Fusarium proliferatum]CZR48810.1 uncharacterized protein FPRO_03869 [Fusarium proliferatum ET1]
MKPVTILLALTSTACTVSAGLPRFAKCTAASQCNSDYCSPVQNADCDEFVNCRDSVCYGASRRARMIGNATPTIAREEDAMTAVILATMPRPGHLTSLWALPVLDSEINAASRNVERNMQCIDNTVIMQMGGHGPFPVQNGPSRR